MRFGLFGGAQAPRSAVDDAGQGFREYVETNVEADRLGFYSTFLVEHHFSGVGQVSSPLDLLSWVASRTSSIRVGTAVLVLPWHDPVVLAERAATLDLLSGGRLDLGVGKGYRHSEFAGFCVPEAEAEERFEESLALILKAWVSDTPFSHEGRFWRYHEISRGATDCAEAASTRLDRGRQTRVRSQGRRVRCQPAARPVRLHRSDR